MGFGDVFAKAVITHKSAFCKRIYNNAEFRSNLIIASFNRFLFQLCELDLSFVKRFYFFISFLKNFEFSFLRENKTKAGTVSVSAFCILPTFLFNDFVIVVVVRSTPVKRCFFIGKPSYCITGSRPLIVDNDRHSSHLLFVSL